MTRHLHKLKGGKRPQHLPRGGRLSIPAAQVARIMERDGLRAIRRDLQPPFPDEPGQELTVVLDLEPSAEGRIFVLECVEAVRAVGKHPMDLVAVEALDRLACQVSEKAFLAHPPGRVARANLPVAQYPVIHTQVVEDFDHGSADRLPIGIEASCAADPVE